VIQAHHFVFWKGLVFWKDFKFRFLNFFLFSLCAFNSFWCILAQSVNVLKRTGFTIPLLSSLICWKFGSQPGTIQNEKFTFSSKSSSYFLPSQKTSSLIFWTTAPSVFSAQEVHVSSETITFWMHFGMNIVFRQSGNPMHEPNRKPVAPWFILIGAWPHYLQSINWVSESVVFSSSGISFSELDRCSNWISGLRWAALLPSKDFELDKKKSSALTTSRTGLATSGGFYSSVFSPIAGPDNDGDALAINVARLDWRNL